jgi:hypothetical protein
MLTKRQFAAAVGASEKWVDNACRILELPAIRDEPSARRLAAVHEIAHPFGMRLDCAAALATQALALDPRSGRTVIGSHSQCVARLVFDVQRFHSRFGVAFAAALLQRPHRPGRPAPRFPRGARSRPAILTAAAAKGVDVQLIRSLAFATPGQRFNTLGNGARALLRDLIRADIPFTLAGDAAALARGAPRFDALLDLSFPLRHGVPARVAALLATWNARLRGVSGEFPFLIDEQTIAESAVLVLDTAAGSVILRRSTDREFAAHSQGSDLLDLGTLRALVPRLPVLIATLGAARRAVSATAIPELEAAAIVLNRID